MGEKINFESPEPKAITERTFEQYRNMFALPEEYLTDKNILDIGSGFSDFVRSVNEKYGTTGTRAIGVDPVYAFFKGDYRAFAKSIRGSGLFADFSYGNNLPSNIKSSQELDAMLEKFYQDFKAQTRSGKSHIAGSHQSLPIKDGSMDLVLGSNSVTSFENRNITKIALEETVRVLNSSGEARFKPISLDWDEDTSSVCLNFNGNITREIMEKLQKTGTLPDREMLKIFQDFEAQGITFYTIISKFPKEEGSLEKKTFSSNIILRKDDKVPELKKGIEGSHEMRKLYFSRAEKDYYIPSEPVQ